MSDELREYIKEIRQSTSLIFKPLRRQIEELAVELLDEDVYIDKVWFSFTKCEEKIVVADCYDGNGVDLKVTARWEFDPSYMSSPCALQYVLDYIDMEELDV